MKQLLGKVSLVLIFGIVLPLQSWAWNATGHRIVATIAYNNLSPDVKRKVDSLTANLKTEY